VSPQPAAPWNGVRQATAYRSDCMQNPFPSDAPLGTPPVIANFAEDGTMIPRKDPWGPELDAASPSRFVK